MSRFEQLQNDLAKAKTLEKMEYEKYSAQKKVYEDAGHLWLECVHKVEDLQKQISIEQLKEQVRSEVMAEIQAQQQAIVPTSTVDTL